MPKRFLFRGQHLTIAEAATLAGVSPRQILRRIRGDVIEETAPPRGGPKPKRYKFRGRYRTVKEIAALLGCSEGTVYNRRSVGCVLELDEIAPLPPEGANNERRIRFRGITHNIAEWGRITGFGRWCIYQRLDKLGWSIERTLTTPVAHPRRFGLARMTQAFRRARNAHAIARMVEAFAASSHASRASPIRGVSETFPTPLGTGGRSRVNDLH